MFVLLLLLLLFRREIFTTQKNHADSVSSKLNPKLNEIHFTWRNKNVFEPSVVFECLYIYLYLLRSFLTVYSVRTRDSW